MSTAIVTGSLSDIMQKEDKTLAESFLSCDAILIVDTSGSMAAHDAPGGLSRHDAAQRELARLQKTLPGKLAVVAFSSDVQFCPSGIPFRFDGGTNMAKALQFVKPADGCGVKLFLISDGEPNSKRDTLAVAKTFQTRINTIFIGPEDGGYWDGRKFLQKLADATGGSFAQTAEVAMFANDVEQLLLRG
jgi:Mg-chelatase subunit ChlD